MTGSEARSQSWAFKTLGDFNSQTTDGTKQTRGHNKQNEITSVSGATTPTYDAEGNLTKDQAEQQYVYDAWVQWVLVKNSGGTTIATDGYDGVGRRVTVAEGGTITTLYYSDE